MSENQSASAPSGVKAAALLVSAVAWSMAAFHLYTGIFGVFESVFQRSVHVGFAMLLVFLLQDARGNKRRSLPPWYDWIFLGLILASVGYVVLNSDEIASRYSYVTPLSDYEVWAGVAGTLVLMEASRRNMGLAMPIICAVFLVYVFVGPYLPGLLSHQGFTIMWAVDQIFYTTEGIWGIPAGVSSTFIVMFVIFAAFLEQSKGGDFFIDLALGLFGKARGGPAKAAVVMLTKQCAMEWGCHGVRVNAISPGLIRTPLSENIYRDPANVTAREAVIPLRRIGTPADVAGLAVFLASQESSYITGQDILIDGGLTDAVFQALPGRATIKEPM